MNGKSEARISFICAVRGHENFHESMSVFPLVMVVAAYSLKSPMLAAMCGFLFGTGRILYAIGYATGDGVHRFPGHLFGHIGFFGLSGFVAVRVLEGLLM
eukprot:NODE_2737_length_873_cov_81.639563_g2258_i0.p2 GENE.NODE_2737_length_873_cov_81.639563_g2258_i0~~NODE_2737_length_873_cov_81.639563_g2258_i0.p2  ORF type:complete len:100 (-),score=8.57 NODE_2737_length_873_cov_81.639563_g2258_i0:126-425(-)